ncbi:probable cysteine desulfurase [Dreissena polymorpha]|uniref:probable cysteine desulfurase n=1 Tax=Dreissena polymorpha TaxID=45954 RepID=UPI0022642759|nr:probable cysteine desulfurase [Dreissena polymorpha]
MSVANGKSFRNEPQKTDVDTDYEEVITVIKKRVGGGYKYIEVKREKPIKRRTKRLLRNNESKTSGDEMEKEDGPEKFTDEVINCEDRIRFDEYPILKYIQENVIGHNLTILGPFGVKKVIYCDYTASGRSLAFIEDYIRNFVQPFYANTHSETGRNSRQTSKFREEARSIIKRCVNADKDDVVIFTGSGATAAIHKLCWGLKINMPRVAEETVVFSGPYEHHSNMLLWKEFGATVVRIRDTQDGVIDIEHLEKELKFWKEKKRQMLVCVSAASNVTGIITDTEEVAIVAHRYGAFAAFDYAGGGPYLKIDMNPSKQGYYLLDLDLSKDAVFISPHKFVGGPGTPGIVVAKKWMFRNTVPERVGGGTVTYVSRDFHMYTHDIEGREEGGTPAIIESIRTGLVFQLKEAVGEDVILKRDQDLCCRAFGVWERNPNLKILGNHRVERITIFSFIVIHEGTNKFIHYNFVSTLLNDLFGIQSRGGCVCAGPYGHDLLGITETMAKRLKWFTHTQPG